MDPTLSAATGRTVSSAVVDQLERTKGWTRFFSVMLWIGALLLLLGGLVVMMASIVASGTMGDQFGGMIGGMVIGALYSLVSLLYIYPALKLGSFSSRISDLMATPNEANLVAALDQQRAFWLYVGIWTIIGIALTVGMVVLSLLIPLLGAAASAGAA